MSAAPKKQTVRHLGTPNSSPKPDPKLQKMELETLKDFLQKKIIDNPAVARKAAVVISLWLNQAPKTKKKAA